MKLLLICLAGMLMFPFNSYGQEPRKIDEVFDLKGRLYSQTDLFSDKNNGFYKIYHPNGRLASELRYKDGWQVYDKAFDEDGNPIIRKGVINTYYADGHLESTGMYRNDQKQGVHKYFYYDGTTVVDIWHYLDGRQVDYHIRNDANGNFLYQEDKGYPTYYVKKLQSAVMILAALLIVTLTLLGYMYWRQRKY